ncbi:hypothetical protein [Pseudoduganella buxea]|uniref:Uncharacterized protein n=1 Tax=Pseudoduganella buxea TaxID=1949069 RepID=A0A6I3STM0_9BURK|nr:hypothetical protein [Pseudoduganella buxea]MTV51267.1 hypothetical protein [Pseudoduganella buxea]GGB97076.1 hypothetical protein GCM10011572_18750 [Pseudoduganella buxea]
MQQTLNRIDTAPPLRRPAFAVGLLVSVLLHVLLLWFLRLPSAPVMPSDTRPWTQPLTVRLVPPPPPPVVVERTTPTSPAPARRERTRPERSQAVTVTPRQAASETAAPTVPEPVPQPEEPRVDLDAARAAARGMANDLDPPATNWAAEKLNKGKEWRETRDEKLGKAVARSARPECRDTGAGLLSPLVWLMDKKGSGCKF